MRLNCAAAMTTANIYSGQTKQSKRDPNITPVAEMSANKESARGGESAAQNSRWAQISLEAAVMRFSIAEILDGSSFDRPVDFATPCPKMSCACRGAGCAGVQPPGLLGGLHHLHGGPMPVPEGVGARRLRTWRLETMPGGDGGRL
jgi:hypothetical protein